MPPTPSKYSKSPKFAKLSAYERARRIGNIRDKGKRAAAQKFWGLDGGGGGLLDVVAAPVRGPAQVLKHAVGDVPQLAESFYETGRQIGTAGYHDIRAGRGITKPGGLLVGKSETGDIARQMVTSIPGQLKLLADPKAWYEDPLIQSINLAGLVLPAARGASIGRLATTLRAANPELSVARATKLATAESFHPGFARAQGYKGGLAPRLVRGHYGPEEGVLGRMPSRQPVMRGAQRAIDRAQEYVDLKRPQSRLTSSAKAQRLEQRQRTAAINLAKAKRADQERKVIDGLLGPGLSSNVRRILDRPGRTNRPRAAALVAGLEAPKDLSLRDAAALKIRLLHDVLEENDQLAPRQKAIDDLEAQRADALETDPEVDTTILDQQIARQRGQLDVLMGRDVPELDSPSRTKVHSQMVATIGKNAADDQIKQWDLAAWGNDLDNPTAFYDKVEVQRLADAGEFRPEGAAVHFQTGKGWKEYKADPSLDTSARIRRYAEHDPNGGRDRNEMAATLVDEDEAAFPGQWEQTGFSRGDAISEYLHEIDRELGPEALYQRMAADQGRWFFPIQRVLDDMGDKTLQIGQLYAALKKRGISTEELRNSGMEEAAQRSPDVVVTPSQVLGELHAGGYFRTFDPDIQITRHDPYSGGYETKYDPYAMPQINSRDAAPGEYHEMVVRYPELPGTHAGEQHWGKSGNVYHVRYQIFVDENGQRVMLIDEIQSDWASDVRRAKKAGETGVPPSPMGQKRYLNNAVRQVLREADNEDVDYVVLVDGDTQALRNKATDLGADDGVTVEDGFDNGTYGEWVDDTTGEPLTNEEITQKLRAQGLEGNFTRLYNKEAPEAFRKVAGAEGRYLDDAYTGRHSAVTERDDFTGYEGYVQTEDSAMPGTVFEMTPDVLKKIREDQPLYQRRPGDGTPLGATEFLANGQRRVTMFQGANATTWSHELIHVLTPDLTPEHKATLEREIASGKPYEEWGTTEHEALAKAWDTYWRDGYAPPSLREVFADLIRRMKRIWKETGHEAHQINRQTAEVFDRMLGKRYNNSVILKEADINAVEADIKDLRSAIDSGDVDRMDEALAALTELSAQAEQAGVEILTRGKSEAERAAILEGLATRKNAVVDDYRRRGLLQSHEDARGYFPHMSMWEGIGSMPSDAVRMAATGDVVGTPRVTAKTVNRNRNRLIRLQTGQVLNDPAVVTYILRARLRLLETIRARRDLYAVGDPIERGQPTMRDMVYVRNPDVTPEKMHAATTAANRLSERDFRDLSARQLADEVDEINDVDGMADEMFWDPGKDKTRPPWVENEDNVRVVPRRIAQNRLGDVFRSAPRGNLMAAVGVTNALFRISSIYLRPWRYIPVNYAQNAVMLAITNPRAFTNLVKRDVARLTKDDPQLRHMIRDQVGTIQATALPEFNIRPQTRMQGLERNLTQASGQFGEVLGRYADVPIREAAWLNHAGKYGFTTAADFRRLIEDPDLAEVRDIVAQRTKEDLIDFDTLTPYEKEVMTRYLALWPFIRGITKWPFMYAREYPARITAASLAAESINQPETKKTVQDMGIIPILGKNINVGKLDPSAPGREAVQNAVALMRGVSKVSKGEQPDLTAFGGNYLTPGLREVLGMATGEGRKNWVQSVGRTFVPGAGIGLDVKKGGSISDQALRQMGLVRERTDGVKKEVKEWMAPIDKLTEQIRDKGKVPPPVLIEMQKLRAPYGDWKQYESERKFAKRDLGESDALTHEERVVGLLDVAKQYYPALYLKASTAAKGAGWESFEQMLDSGKAPASFLESVDKYMYDEMFGKMTEIKRQAKEAGYAVE